jgi:putative sterol carrier protein
MIEKIFQELPGTFVPGAVANGATYYFSLGDIKKTVVIDAQKCLVIDGRTRESADCVCKTTPEFFAKIWNDGYRPGMKDFLAGTIKSNNPGALQDFLRAFGK